MPGLQVDKHWVEIVRVRLADIKDGDRVRLFFADLSALSDPPPVKTALFKSADITTDWSIHMIWPGKKEEAKKTHLGAWLSSQLSEFGLVNHSTWVRIL